VQRAYKEITKQLLPAVLYPSTTEYHDALEKYLEKHARNYIETIGENGWISLFEEKLLPEVSYF